VADRLLEVADVAVAAIDAAWTGKGANDAVSRAYGVEETLDTIVGRQVYVFPIGDAEVERLDRATVVREYQLAIIAVEKSAAAGLPSKEWMDERLLFCRQKVYDVLNVDRVTEYLGTPATLYTQSIDRDVAYDFDAFRDHSVFWCEINVRLREAVAG
jgi:hypothetical protein